MNRISRQGVSIRDIWIPIREIFDYPEAEREIAKLGKLVAEIHANKIE